MMETYFREMIVLAGAGFGVSAYALGVFLAGPARWWPAAGGFLVGTAAAGFGVALVLDPEAGLTAAGLAAGVAVVVRALGSAWLTAVCRRPAGRAAGLAAVGLTLVIGGIARFDTQEEAEDDADGVWLMKAAEMPATREAAGVVARTDRDRRLTPREPTEPRTARELRTLSATLLAELPQITTSIARGPASDDCNCHGWVFTGGRYWLGADDVQAILDENGYAAVSDPRPDDVAIYRQGNSILHTAVVRAVGDRIPVLVEGKWGWMGVYLHPIDATCYGKGITYYRSPREGHLVAGIGGRASAAGEPMGEGGQ